MYKNWLDESDAAPGTELSAADFINAMGTQDSETSYFIAPISEFSDDISGGKYYF